MKELKEKPDINHEYKLQREREPVHLRASENNFEDHAQRIRNEKSKKDQLEDAECTFNPNTSRRSVTPKQSKELVEGLMNWQKQKDSELILKITSGAYEPQYPFKPEINKKSVKIVT